MAMDSADMTAAQGGPTTAAVVPHLPTQRRAPAGLGAGAASLAISPSGYARVDDATLGAAVVHRAPRTRPQRGLLHRPAQTFALEVTAVGAAGIAVAVVLDTAPLLAVGVVIASLLSVFHSGTAAIRVGLPHVGRLVTQMAMPFAGVAAAVSVAELPAGSLRDSGAMILTMTAASAALSIARRHFAQPTRIAVVGDAEAIAKSATRWAGDRRTKVVGGLLLNASDDNPPVIETHGVRTMRGIDEVPEWVEAWAVDLVVVVPGPGITSDSVRRLSWLLEDTEASLAVLGVFDSIAPHRIDATQMAGATLIHARSSRPSLVVRSAKYALDRAAGAALLAIGAPVLLALWAWVRLDSRGPGLFTQVRVGVDGKEFRIYKLRTMRTDAEETKGDLSELDEGNGVLFKMHDDPRITRAGRFLRKSSLDELPQLINVVRGEMSLVGPRPALPSEVAEYDELARRRLAVRPGMTGLWQVSGRSDLSWEESVELDVRYADNYRLTDDLVIGLRTFEAVARAKGAY